MLLEEDGWVGDAVSGARIAYETWIALVRGEIKIEPESSPSLLGGSYSTLFTDYAKVQLLSAVAALHRGFFKMEKGVLVKKKVALRMLKIKAVSEEQMDNLLKLTAPLHDFRNKDQHKESSKNPPIYTLILDGARHTIFTATLEEPVMIDPSALSALYELLKSLEPAIGRVAFIRAVISKLPK